MVSPIKIKIIYLAILTMVLVACLPEPDYLDTKKTDLPVPSILLIKQIDAFSLQINWRIPQNNFDLADGFIIETFAIDENTIRNEFDTYLDNNEFSRKIILYNSDARLTHLPAEDDTVQFSFIDDSASFKRFNYYRITIFVDEIESYSVRSDSGFFFDMSSPKSLTIEQLNDFQLKLTWNKSQFADGYRVERNVGGEIDTTFDTTDTTWAPSSYHPTYDILTDTDFSVNGLQPNTEYTFKITAYADKDNIRRASDLTSKKGILNLSLPVIMSINALNNSSIRLYLPKDNLESHYDSLFILKKYSSVWSFFDTLLLDSNLNQVLYENNYLIDVPSNTEGEFKIVTKGKINALASNILIGTPLALEGFSFVEGGDFAFSVTGKDTTVSSFYMSNYEYTGLSTFPSIKGDVPEDNINWANAVLICSTLTKQYENVYTFRLPSVAEWEYAAKWDLFNQDQDFTGYDYPWRSNRITQENANYINSSFGGLSPTGYYDGSNGTTDSNNAFGIYDLGGNVLEWCGRGNLAVDLNEIVGTSYGGNDALKPMRGGGYWNSPDNLKTTQSFQYDPETKVSGFGIRIVMEK